MLRCLAPVLFNFKIQGVLKFWKGCRAESFKGCHMLLCTLKGGSGVSFPQELDTDSQFESTAVLLSLYKLVTVWVIYVFWDVTVIGWVVPDVKENCGAVIFRVRFNEFAFWTSWPWRWSRVFETLASTHSVLQETELWAASLWEPPSSMCGAPKCKHLLEHNLGCQWGSARFTTYRSASGILTILVWQFEIPPKT
jgi:hypothetical protein